MPSTLLRPKAIVLGSGTSQGVPMIGCRCATCLSTDPRDKRTRSSLYLTDGISSILIDTTPELRLQCLRENIQNVHSILFTHQHADHIMGFDDLRRFCDLIGTRLPIYASEEVIATLKRIFPYAFDPSLEKNGYLRIIPHIIEETFQIGRFTIHPFPLPHGKITTLGFLFELEKKKILAYLIDCKTIPQTIIERLLDVEVLIIDALRDEPHPTHLCTSEAITMAQRIGAKKTYFTHLTHHKSHKERQACLPPNIYVAYDGLAIDL
ncbi:metallo-beta-lactamase [Methylacidiphilum kamchatkense Kam1]|uniref:Metallo-beta-lactamase n=1 Tax=Methylacidiphilum kamchatkense Kam1 TaxID=1202785 RepID=A0A0C1RTY3_9BACT|nr:MBL fold metallo-hydrolase [Methylacidiphilum kamchatkense]KIE58446.1 metallo-beta-lactamase [Methylacidiphilum kamchatkense Kam1]QDQ43260.1 phosphoribosyl 1,2-cyclic phosphate phosphodiesterase [Methylacidiphilum kamchatkense Kam1]